MLGYKHTRPLTTCSSWWLFLVNNFLWSTTILKHSHKLISCVVDEKSGTLLNLINAFAIVKSENESILFFDKFFTTSHWQFWWYRAKFHVDDKQIIDEKKSLTSFCFVCQQPYTKSQSPREIFITVVFLITGRMGPEDFWQTKKRGHQFFKQQTLLPL